MTSAVDIIDRFGGIRPLAKKLSDYQKSIGKEAVEASVVQGWKERGRIPVWWGPQLMGLAEQEGVPLKYEEFFQSLPASKPRRKRGRKQ